MIYRVTWLSARPRPARRWLFFDSMWKRALTKLPPRDGSRRDDSANNFSGCAKIFLDTRAAAP